jgi:signal transduction histidine kinase
MSVANTITLLFNGLTVALALGFLLIVLWQNARKELNQFFAIFLFLVTLWNVGSLLTLAISLVDPKSPFIGFGLSMMELGFIGASIAIYALTAILVGVHTQRFRRLAFLSLIMVLGYQIFLIVNNSPIPFEPLGNGFYKYRFQPLAAIFYLAFDGMVLYLVWRYRRKLKFNTLIAGLNLFVVGQSLGFLNPELGIVSLSINLSSFAALLISFAILRQEIITPLSERITQVEAVHKVSLAITSQIAIDTVLNQIATQAVGWLAADAACIFLTQGETLDLATVHNLPNRYLHSRLRLGEGVAGTVAKTHRTIHLENYGRDWKSASEVPLARETFGSTIAVPLIYGGEAIGVLMVIAGKQGRLFQKEDVELLELLGSQAAVAIAHSHLFLEQQQLTGEVEEARSQLETVLTSTENPVIAVDRSFHLIFANPAAKTLFPKVEKNLSLFNMLPSYVLPTNHWDVIRILRRSRAYVYEITIEQKTYLCHLAQLGRPRPEGWVAVLNDVTQLKELDRIKSEMVRMTSHDLKNPLQAAMANLELLTEDLTENTSEEVHKSLDVIQKQLLRMNRIINGILDLERLKSGTPKADLCSVREAITQAIEELQYLADDQQIALEATIEDNIANFWADPEQFERALINLVENAIKFTPKDGHVYIRARQEQDNILFEVQDTGIGIPENLQSQVFERFLRGGERGQKGAEHISGSGLGLSLAKTIIENHHGSISLTSKVGLGTTFYLRLPAASEESSNINFV